MPVPPCHSVGYIQLENLEKMDVGPLRLHKHNVEVFDHEGAVVAGAWLSMISFQSRLADRERFAGFWQYGTLQWDNFYI